MLMIVLCQLHKEKVSVSQAVVTRGQKKRPVISKTKPLKVMPSEVEGIERKDLISLQKQDSTLRKCFTQAKGKVKRKSGQNNTSWFEINDGLLMRYYESPKVQFGEKVRSDCSAKTASSSRCETCSRRFVCWSLRVLQDIRSSDEWKNITIGDNV